METQFTPFASLFGGAMIGLAAVLLMLTTGRLAGVSGIVSGLLPPRTTGQATYTGVAFVIGLLVAIPIYLIATGGLPDQSMVAGLPVLAVAGLLVGFGTVLGNGCTSGHGVCGLSRLSQRSIAATITFMAVAFLTVFVWRHVLGGQ